MQATYPNPWLFNGIPFESENIGKSYGFVYLITNLTNGMKYIGRKYFTTIRKTKGFKKRVRKEGDWKQYYGSNARLLADIAALGADNFKREILSLHSTMGDVNYTEVKQQFLNNVLESEDFYNDNINGKWYKKPIHILEGRRSAGAEQASGQDSD